MSENSYAILGDRGILSITGEDRVAFLQKLVSNDVARTEHGRAVYAALLTPQGKFLFDFLIAPRGDALLLDGERARLGELAKRLSIFKLRAKVELTDTGDEMSVAALFGPQAANILDLAAPGEVRPLGDGVVFIDPRLPTLGARAILPASRAASTLEALGFSPVAEDDYHRHRLTLGVPEGSRDITPDKGLLLEHNLDDLDGVDFTKGCYIGQEVTTRSKHRGQVRKRLFIVHGDAPLPAPGAAVSAGERAAGEMKSAVDKIGLALLRVDRVAEALADGAPLTAEGVTLQAEKPGYATF